MSGNDGLTAQRTQKGKDYMAHRDRPETLWTVAQLCDAFGVARATVYAWTHQGYLPHVKLGSCVRFRPSEVGKWLEDRALAGRSSRVPEVET